MAIRANIGNVNIKEDMAKAKVIGTERQERPLLKGVQITMEATTIIGAHGVAKEKRGVINTMVRATGVTTLETL